MDLMGLDKNHFYPINIHIGVTKPTKQEAAERFCKKFELLSESCKSRLTVENDDGPNQFSVKDLWELVHAKIGIPIVFDQHHFNFGPKDLSMEESLILAHSTWKTKPLTHMSSSRRIEDPKSGVRAHADLIWERILTFGLEFDTEIEAKLKDVALLHYRNNFS